MMPEEQMFVSKKSNKAVLKNKKTVSLV